MTNKNKKDNLPNIPVSIGANKPSKEKKTINLVGQEISINLKRQTFWGIGAIWLSPKNYWCKIPDGMSEKDYAIIQKGLDSGVLVLGNQYIHPLSRGDTVLAEYWYAIKDTGFDADATKKFSNLLNLGVDRGFTALEIAKYCSDNEQSYKKRKAILRPLDEILSRYGGTILPYEPPDDAQGIKKVIIKDGKVIRYLNDQIVPEGTVVDKSGANMRDPIPSKEAEKALNDLFK